MNLQQLGTRSTSRHGPSVCPKFRQARFRPAVAAEPTPATKSRRGAPDLEISSLQNIQHQVSGTNGVASNGLHPAASASLRDATATASTSGLDHLSLHLVQTPTQVQAQVQSAAAPHANGSSQQQGHSDKAGTKVGQVDDKDLYDEIKACDEWQDVLEVVADEGESMTMRSAVQALGRVNKLAKGLPRSQLEVLRAHPGLRVLVDTLFSQVSVMNPIQVSNSLYACAMLQIEVPQPVLQQYAEQAALIAQKFWPRDISTLLYAFAQLQAKVPHDVLDRLCFRAQGFLTKGEFEPQGISMVLHSCVILGYKNSLLNRAAALQAGIQLHRFYPQAIANTVWSLAHMAFYHKPVIEGALATLAARPDDFKPQEVCNILWATTRQRHHPGGALYPIVQSLLERSASLTGRDFITVLYTLATFNIAPGTPVLRKIMSELAPQLDDLPVSELASVYWSLGMMRETEVPLFAELERQLAARHAAQPLEEALLRMTFQGFVCSRLNGSQRAPEFSPLMLDAMKRVWIGAAAVSNSDSAVLDVVVDILQQLKVRHDSRRPSKDGLVQIDIALKPSADRFVALQIVVDEDQAINTGQLLATAVFQKAVLERTGWEVKHLPVKDVHALSDARLRLLFVSELLTSMGVKHKSVPRDSLEAYKDAKDAAVSAAAASKRGRASGASPTSPQQQSSSPSPSSSAANTRVRRPKPTETDILMQETQRERGTRRRS